MSWSDIYKLWKLAGSAGPIERQEKAKEIEGAGVGSSNSIPDIRADGSFHSGGRSMIRLRDSTDFIDLSSVTNRASRYKEYERLRYMAEIETAMTVYTDESCVGGDTQIATPFGFVTISELATTKDPDERFLVYCFDFAKQDFTFGWAYHPRKVKRAKTVKIALSGGNSFTATEDHRVLLRTGEWTEAGKLKFGDELMPFYRVPANPELTKSKRRQYPRIYSLLDGWKHENHALDEWRGEKRTKKTEDLFRILRMCNSDMSCRKIGEMFGRSWQSIQEKLWRTGFSVKEMKCFRKWYPDRRRVIGVFQNGEEDVYDLSVEGHENFATNTTVFHNCQIGEHGHMFEIISDNNDIKKELEFLFFHPKMLNVDRKLFTWAKNLYIFGDTFLELVIDPEDPKAGIIKIQTLPADSMYRIETIKGKLLEFQQSKDGPDYQSLARVEVTQATQSELAEATAIRFAPESIIHMKIGDDRKLFYPYGVSLVEAARGPAHQLRLFEDAMLVYRLSRSPERRIFYIDVGNMPPFKAEAFIDRLKDQLRKKKTFSSHGGVGGNSQVEERWQAPAQDEDFWIPIRPNANSRIETLPGAQNLDQIDDALYFRNKLFIALNFPKHYMAQEDTAVTRSTLSSVDVKFARVIERLQMTLADGMTEIALRHLELRGFPERLYDDLQIKFTAPSHWREISENEVIEARFNRAIAIKGSQIFADMDIMTRILKIPQEEAKEIVARAFIQKTQDLKLQMMSQNPQLMGLAIPGPQGNEMGTEAGGPNPDFNNQEQQPPQEGEEKSADDTYGKQPKAEGKPLPTPTEKEIHQYDLEILDYSQGLDDEEVDSQELDEWLLSI